jgi:regulator of PEP synthase PpsR (kinase-PPPase family)
MALWLTAKPLVIAAQSHACARALCAKHNWSIIDIDVTRRSIEETAAAVMALLADRRRQAAS